MDSHERAKREHNLLTPVTSASDDTEEDSQSSQTSGEVSQPVSRFAPSRRNERANGTTRRASLPGAFRIRTCTSFSGNDAQAENDERADDDDSLLFASGPAILTAPAEPESRRSSPMTLSPNDIDIEVEATAVEESTVVEGTPIDVDSTISEISYQESKLSEKTKRVLFGAFLAFVVITSVLLAILLPRSQTSHAQTVGQVLGDGSYVFMGCYKDKYPTKRDLPLMLGAAEYDHTSCYHGCRLQGYAYFGLQFWGECHCGNVYGQFGKVECTDCSESADFFGGNVNCVYEII